MPMPTIVVIDTDWLAAASRRARSRVLDASWHLPAASRNAKAEFLTEHIPGALFFDIDEIADTASPLPHMLPPAEKFASRVPQAGHRRRHAHRRLRHRGLFSAARVWWMFRVFGHDDVAVLDGGLPKWKAEGRPLETDRPAEPRERHFTPRFNALLVRDRPTMKARSPSDGQQIADARAPGRFAAEEPEPRPGVRGGHIPGARNVPLCRPAQSRRHPEAARRRLRRRLSARRRRLAAAGGHHLRLAASPLPSCRSGSP